MSPEGARVNPIRKTEPTARFIDLHLNSYPRKAARLVQPNALVGSLAAVCVVLLTLSADAQIRALVLLTAVAVAMFYASTSSRACWIIYVAATTASGQSVSFESVTLLPEHLVLVLLGVRLLAERQRRSSAKTWPIRNMAVVLTSWLILNFAVSLLLAPSPSQSVRLLLWTSANILALTLIVCWNVSLLNLVRDGLWTIVALYGTYVALWLQANFTGVMGPTVDVDYATTAFRAKGLMLEPNLFAALALLWLSVAYIFRRSLSTTLILLAVCILGGGIIATYTRASMIGFAVVATMLIGHLARGGRDSAKVRTILWLVAVAAIVWLILTPPSPDSGPDDAGGIATALGGRLAAILDFGSGTAAYRLNSVSVAWSEISGGDWMGHGYNSFPQTHFDALASDGRSYIGVLWVVLLYDGGVFGLVLFLTLMVMAWRVTPAGSWVLFFSFVIVSTATNPIWYAFPWIAFALVLKSSRLDQDTSFSPLSLGEQVAEAEASV